MASTARPLRADARRNRERLLAAAARAFAQSERAGGAEVTLDAIAKDAGVGIGTLYRHFPTREALIDAAYQNELARLCDAVAEVTAVLPPDQALRAWMDRFVDYMTTKRGMAGALRAVIAAGVNPFAHSRDRMLAALETLLSAAQPRFVRSDVTAADVLAGLSGISMATSESGQRSRLLDLMMDGLRSRP